MSNEEFSLGDDSIEDRVAVTKEIIAKSDAMIADSAKEIEKPGHITEEDEMKVQKKQIEIKSKVRTEDQEMAQLSIDLNEFILEKIGINNDNGGNIEKFSTGIDL